MYTLKLNSSYLLKSGKTKKENKKKEKSQLAQSGPNIITFIPLQSTNEDTHIGVDKPHSRIKHTQKRKLFFSVKASGQHPMY